VVFSFFFIRLLSGKSYRIFIKFYGSGAAEKGLKSDSFSPFDVCFVFTSKIGYKPESDIFFIFASCVLLAAVR